MPATPYALTDAANSNFAEAPVAIPQAWSDISVHYNMLVRLSKELIALVNGSNAGTGLHDYTGAGIVDKLYALDTGGVISNALDLVLSGGVSAAGNRSIKFWLASASTNFAQLLYNNASSYFKFQNQASIALRVKGATATESDDFVPKAQMDAAIAALTVFTPAQSMQTASSSAPTKWTFEDGKALSRTTYSELFNKIGTTYGVGDGSTTFNVPDVRGTVKIGPDNMGGTSANRVVAAWADIIGGRGGHETQTLSAGQGPIHGHDQGAVATSGSGTNRYTPSNGTTSPQFVTGLSGNGDPFDNMPPSIAYPSIIYTGV